MFLGLLNATRSLDLETRRPRGTRVDEARGAGGPPGKKGLPAELREGLGAGGSGTDEKQRRGHEGRQGERRGLRVRPTKRGHLRVAGGWHRPGRVMEDGAGEAGAPESAASQTREPPRRPETRGKHARVGQVWAGETWWLAACDALRRPGVQQGVGQGRQRWGGVCPGAPGAQGRQGTGVERGRARSHTRTKHLPFGRTQGDLELTALGGVSRTGTVKKPHDRTPVQDAKVTATSDMTHRDAQTRPAVPRLPERKGAGRERTGEGDTHGGGGRAGPGRGAHHAAHSCCATGRCA